MIGLVLAIWGVVSVRLISSLSPKNDSSLVTEGVSKTEVAFESSSDSIIIFANYRDPFLGSSAPIRTTEKKKTSPKPKKVEGPKRTITYDGYVASGNGARDGLFFVTINGGQQMLKIGQKHEGLLLVKGDAKKIVVSYDNRRETHEIR